MDSSIASEDPLVLDAKRSARPEPVDLSEPLHPQFAESHAKLYVFHGGSSVPSIEILFGIEDTEQFYALGKGIEVHNLPFNTNLEFEGTKQFYDTILALGKGIEVTKQPCAAILVAGGEPKNEKDAGIEVGSGANKIDLSTCTLLHKIDLSDQSGSKVEEIMVAATAQAAISLMGYYLNSSTFSAEVLFVVGANALGFVGSLTSLLLRGKNRKAANVLRKIGAVAASSAMVTAMTMFVPANHKLWVTSLACLLPAVAVAVA